MNNLINSKSTESTDIEKFVEVCQRVSLALDNFYCQFEELLNEVTSAFFAVTATFVQVGELMESIWANDIEKQLSEPGTYYRSRWDGEERNFYVRKKIPDLPDILKYNTTGFDRQLFRRRCWRRIN